MQDTGENSKVIIIKGFKSERDIAMGEKNVHLVTGGLGYLGKYIIGQLIEDGRRVRTVTNSPDRPNPFGRDLEVGRYHFEDAELLKENFRDVKVFYNTFWIRFEHGGKTFEWALENTKKLLAAAAQAGVERIVHISVLNCDRAGELKYYRFKALAEEAVAGCGPEYSLIRPTLIFGREDLLINNIAWSLRHLPAMGVFGRGRYRIRPVHVDDLARIAVEEGGESGNRTVEAVGPDEFEFIELVRFIKRALGVKRPVMPVPVFAGYLATRVMGFIKRDKFLTGDELKALLSGMLSYSGEPAGRISLGRWIEDNADWLGRSYTSELGRRRDRKSSY